MELVDDETHMLMEEDVPSERNYNPNTRSSGVRKNYAQANFLALKLPQHDLDTRYILTQLQEEESFKPKQHSPRNNLDIIDHLPASNPY